MSDEVKAPKPEEVDELALNYAVLDAAAKGIALRLKAMSAERDAAEAKLVPLVLKFGDKHAEKSKLLKGLHHSAMVTVGTRVVTLSKGVDAFWAYLVKRKLPQLQERFFEEHKSYSLVEGPSDVLKTLKLTKRVREKIDGLVKGCFDVKTNTPSLKVTVVAAVKP